MGDGNNEAAKPNPTLERFSILVGEWLTEGAHPDVPGQTFHGRTVFRWIEGGAFLMMRSEIDEPGIPSGLAIIGSDDAAARYNMLYVDERGISRIIQTALQDRVWTWWRDDPKFSQRFACTISNDCRSILAKGEMSKDGGAWRPDLQLTYRRA